jgi:molybdopterin-binding protein
MVYCTGMVCEVLPGPVTVIVTFDVPTGVVTSPH